MTNSIINASQQTNVKITHLNDVNLAHIEIGVPLSLASFVSSIPKNDIPSPIKSNDFLMIHFFAFQLLSVIA